MSTPDLSTPRAGPWEKRAACGCGRTFAAWRGKTFFVDVDCCPSCGIDRGDMKICTARWVRPEYAGPWWRRKLTKPGYWEIKP